MHIGIFSDVHDQIDQLRKVLDLYTGRGIGTAIFCGDFVSPIPLRVMGGFQGRIHCVFGNGDGDRFAMSRLAAEQFPNLTLHGEYADIELDGRRYAATHYPFYGHALAASGNYRAVFAGHTHAVEQQHYGDSLFLNPGEVAGLFGPPTCAIYDSGQHSVEMIAL